MHVGIIGGGIAGLVAAYEASKGGARVTLFERSPSLGGLANSFQTGDGQWMERYYHFICRPDRPYLRMIKELGLDSQVRIRTTQMGLFYNGALYPIGDPVSLLAFPHLPTRDKLQFAISTLLAKLRNSSSWEDLENVSARDWLVKQYGERTYEVVFRPLLDFKFREDAPRISAAWMWSRLHRLGNSRTLTQKERVGYLSGGSRTYIDALEESLRSRGVEVRTSVVVERVVVQSGRAAGVQCDGAFWPFDCILSTVPLPFTRDLFAEIEGPYFDNLRQLKYTGVMVMSLRLKRQFSEYFWMNISDARLDICGLIEYTNLNPCEHLGGDGVVYIPQYLPHTHPLYNLPEEDLLRIYCGYLKVINPRFERDWVRGYWVHKDPFAQPICELGFTSHVPSVQTPIDNLFLTDSHQLHPHDRTISNSIELGCRAAGLMLRGQAA